MADFSLFLILFLKKNIAHTHQKRPCQKNYKSDITKLTLQSLLIKLAGNLAILRGNSIASIPFKILLYVDMGSLPVKGGLPESSSNISMPRDQ